MKNIALGRIIFFTIMIPALVWTIYPYPIASVYEWLGEPHLIHRFKIFLLFGFVVYIFAIRMGTWSDRM